MTFVADDPTFRTTYGATVFVGDRYSGGLGSAETINLVRADGSNAATVSYGGAGWPVPTSGQSLELVTTAADNNDPANWVLSQGQGTPVTPRGGVQVAVPGSPTIGPATAGDTTAAVSWTAPADPGGAPISGYRIRVLDQDDNQVGEIRTAGAGQSSTTITDLENSNRYRFAVAAVNSAGPGAYSALSNPVTPNGAANLPGPPVIGLPTRGDVGNPLTAVAHWDFPANYRDFDIVGYRVTALTMSSADEDATVTARTTSRQLSRFVRQYSSRLQPGDYRFEVVAVTADGQSPPSARSAVVVPR